MTDIGELVVRIRADAAQLEREMKRANGVVTQSAGGMTSSLAGLRTQVAGVAAAFGTVSVAALVAFGKSAADAAGHIVDLADRIGFSAGALASLEIPLAASGASLDEFTGAINRMNNILGEAAKGNEEAIRAFDGLGLSVDKLRAMSPEEQFYEIASALGQITDQSTQTEAGMNIFGRTFAALLPLLKEYGGDMRKAAKIQAEANAGFEDSLKRVDQLGDAFSAAGIKARNYFVELLATVLRVNDEINKVLVKPSVNAKWNLPGQNPVYGPNLPKGTLSDARPKTVDYAVFGGGEQYGPQMKSTSARGSNTELLARIQAQKDALKGAKDQADATEKVTEKTKELDKAALEAAQVQALMHDRLASGLTDIAFRANTAGDALRGMAEQIARIAFERRVAGPLVDSLIGSGEKRGLLDSILPSAGSLFGGFFAAGGRPPVGKLSVVGERGPEIFVPDTAGTVIPNHKVGGNTNAVTHVWNIQSGVTRQELASLIPVIESRATAATLMAMRQGGDASRVIGARS